MAELLPSDRLKMERIVDASFVSYEKYPFASTERCFGEECTAMSVHQLMRFACTLLRCTNACADRYVVIYLIAGIPAVLHWGGDLPLPIELENSPSGYIVKVVLILGTLLDFVLASTTVNRWVLRVCVCVDASDGGFWCFDLKVRTATRLPCLPTFVAVCGVIWHKRCGRSTLHTVSGAAKTHCCGSNIPGHLACWQ